MVGYLRVKQEWFVLKDCVFVLFIHGWLLASEAGVVCFERLYVYFRKGDWGEDVWGFGAAEPSIPRCERAFHSNGLALPHQNSVNTAPPSPLTPSAREVMNLAKLEHPPLFPFPRLLLMFSVQTSNSSSC